MCSGGGVSGTVTVHQHPSLPRKSKLQEQFHTVFESFLMISVLIDSLTIRRAQLNVTLVVELELAELIQFIFLPIISCGNISLLTHD